MSTAANDAPTPIDPRGPRLNQAVLTFALVVGFVADWRPVVPIFAVVLLAGAAFGPRYGPVLRFYQVVVRPRLGPASELEDPRPPRFAAAVGVVFLAGSTVTFLAAAPGVAWALALIVAVLAGLAATTGLCIGCEVYLLLARRRREAEAAPPNDSLARFAVPSAPRTWVVFTTPYCATCGPIIAELRAAFGADAVVGVDAIDEATLSRRLGVRRSPTVFEIDGAGQVLDRLIGPEVVRTRLAGVGVS